MAEKAHIQTLFAYHWDTTDRLIAGAAKLSEAEYLDHSSFSHGSIHAIFLHLLQVNYAWRETLATGQERDFFSDESFPTLEAIRAGFVEEQQSWSALLDGLSEEAISESMQMTRYNGVQVSLPRWRAFYQVLFHGMQHHAELAQLLTARGQSPGDIDFIFYRER